MISTIKCPGCERFKAINTMENPHVRNGVHYCSFECAITSGQRPPKLGKSPTMEKSVIKCMRAEQKKVRRGK